MRTHGDDIAQVFALLGVRPRVAGGEPAARSASKSSRWRSSAGRASTSCAASRASSAMRFPHVLGMLDDAVRRVAELDEPPEQNSAARALPGRPGAAGGGRRRSRRRPAAGPATASSARKPGTYGAGILPLIDEGNWQTDADFADGLRQLGRLRLYRRGVRRRRARRVRDGRSAGSRSRPRTRTTASTTSSTRTTTCSSTAA